MEQSEALLRLPHAKLHAALHILQANVQWEVFGADGSLKKWQDFVALVEAIETSTKQNDNLVSIW